MPFDSKRWATACRKHACRKHKQIAHWYGGPYDPDNIDEPKIVAGLKRMARKRTVGKAAYLKSKGVQH